MISKKLVLLTSIIALAVSFGAVADKPIYKWKDSQGNIKYTQSKPPRGVQYDTIYQRASSQQDKNANDNSSNAEENLTAKEDDILAQQEAERERLKKANEEVRKKNCQIAKNNVESLENNQRIMTIVDGKETMLSGEDRIERLNKAKANVAKYCN